MNMQRPDQPLAEGAEPILPPAPRPQPDAGAAADMLGAIDAWGAWDSVQMTDRRMVEGEDCIVLGYAAVARRADGSDFAALCTSTWVRQAEGTARDIDAAIARRRAADPDLWVIEIESRDGRTLLDQDGLD